MLTKESSIRFGAISPGPVKYLDAIPVRIADEEPLGSGNVAGFIDLYPLRGNVLACRSDIADVQTEMPRTNRIGLVLQKQMQIRAAEVEPKSHEVEGSWGRDFGQPKLVAVKPTRSGNIRDEHAAMVDMGHR